MKQLLLIRHAKSSWDDGGLRDIERPLNKRGERDAPFMAKMLKHKKIKPDLIISSSAVRAFNTAKIFASELSYPEAKIMASNSIYAAGNEDLLKAVHLIEESYSTVFLFGHNPELTFFSNYLSGDYIDNIPTCGIVKLDLSVKWVELTASSCTIDFFEYPKKNI